MAFARLDQLNNYAMLTMLALILISSLPQAQVGNPYAALPNGLGPDEIFTIHPSYWSIDTGKPGVLYTDFTSGIYSTFNDVFQLRPEASSTHTINDGMTGYIDFTGKWDATNVQCWVSFGLRSYNESYSNHSRWIMAESHYITTASMYGGNYPKVFTYNLRVDDSNSEGTIVSSVCPGGLLVRWGGSYADSYMITGKAMTAPASLVSALSYSEGSFYMCMNPVSQDIHNITVEGNITARYVHLQTDVVCARQTRVEVIPGTSVYAPEYAAHPIDKYTSPPDATLNKTFVLSVALLSLSDINLKTFDTYATDYLTAQLKGLFSFMNSALDGAMNYLPEPIPTVFKTVGMIVDFIIVAFSFFLCYQLVKYYLNFRTALKTSLLKAAIVGLEVFLILFILVGAFYVLTHPLPYCGVKIGTTVIVLKQMGIEIKSPQSIWDAPVLLWDLAYLGAVQQISGDCLGQFALNSNVRLTDLTNLQGAEPFPLICDPNKLLPGQPGCQSEYVRAAEMIILTVIILVIIGIMFTLFMYLYKKVKTMEHEVRDDDTSYIEKGEEDYD